MQDRRRRRHLRLLLNEEKDALREERIVICAWFDRSGRGRGREQVR